MLEYDFQRYLSAKRTVDDRALNGSVWEGMTQILGRLQIEKEANILEVGAGIGTMARRLVERGAFWRGRYLGLDSLGENISAACEQLPRWGIEHGLKMDRESLSEFHVWDGERDLHLKFAREDIFDFIHQANGPVCDFLVAHAFLDLFDLRSLIPGLVSLVRPGGFLYLTLNFDGETIFEPVWDDEVEQQILNLYHRTMNERVIDGRPSGDSQAGRHLFRLLEQTGVEILRAGASDWVVYPQSGHYPADEAYFLHCILHFFETSLGQRTDVEPGLLAGWIARRREQVERGQLIYIAHQIDFLVGKPF